MSSHDSVEVAFDVPAAMRDGVVLRADVYTPGGGGSRPTLLVRTPYGKDAPETMEMVEPVKAARSGFIVAIQDTRGRSASDGEWKPMVAELDDGFDSVEWAAGLPGSNGRVGMLGDSYCGWTQWAAAAAGPDALKALAPGLTWCDWADGLYRRGGVPELGTQLWWAMFVGFDHLGRLPLPAAEIERRLGALVQEFDGISRHGFWELPAVDLPLLDRHRLPGIPAAVAAGDGDGGPGVVGRHSEIDLPTLNIGGWFDIFLQGTLDNFVEMAKRDTGARLLVGPWSHIGHADPIGEVEFGLLSYRRDFPNNEAGDVGDLQREFLRSHLDADSGARLESKPVRYFTMGVNEWRDADTWPPSDARITPYFLRAGGGLSTLAPTAAEGEVGFDYDPADPVPTRGGATLLPGACPSGPVDQSAIEEREDVVTFTSPPLEQPLEVTGRIGAVLHARSSAPSTDWVVRLCDVTPDGRSMTVCDGIVRAAGAAEALDRHEIDLWSTSQVFLAGHRIRVDVTSSSFPRWERNLNTGDQGSGRLEVACQTLSLSREHPSYVELPILPAVPRSPGAGEG